MSRLVLRDFTADDLLAAGQLLADRHARHRAAEPLLSSRYQDPRTAQAQVAEAWSMPGASGSIAESAGRAVGFLIGAPKASEIWGPNIWIESASHAADDAETVRDLYGHAATRWVAQGRAAHYALVPAHDRTLVDAWSRLGFGQQQMHAIRELPTGPRPTAAVTIRLARRDDIPHLAALDLALPQHQALSPVFSAGQTPSLDEALDEWEEDFDDPTYTVFVAEHANEVIGSAIGCALEKSISNAGLIRPDHAGFLGFAAVLPQSRGLGAGRALGEAVMWWAAEAGFDSVATDWRVTNLLSSRAWPRLGFRDTFVRMHRVVGY